MGAALLPDPLWGLIHFSLLDWLARDDQIDWSRAVVDSRSIRAVYGGDQTGPNPTDQTLHSPRPSPPRVRNDSLLLSSVGIGKRSWNHACHTGVWRATVAAA